MTTAITALQIPFHVIEQDGRLVNSDVSEQSIKELREYAARHNFNLEAECKARFGYGSDWLMRDEYTAMMRAVGIHLAECFEQEPKHFHRCLTCGTSEINFDRHCASTHAAGDVEDECRACEERTTVFYRRSGQ